MEILLAALFYKPNIGGVENSIDFLSKEYDKLKHDVTIAATNLPTTLSLQEEEYDGNVKIKRFKWKSSFFSPLDIFTNFFPLVIFFKKLSLNKKDTIVIVRHHFIGICLKMAGFKKIGYVIPEVVQYRKYRLLSKLYFAYRLDFIFQRIACKSLKNVICFSERIRRDIFQNFNVDAIRITPGVNLEKFRKFSKADARKILNIQDSDVVFLGIGRFVEVKGYSLAIKAFSKISNSNVTLFLVGDGPELKNYFSEIEHLGLSDRVRIYNRTDQPELFYAAADVFLMTSFSETFGQTTLEAMAAGNAIIAFSNGTYNGVTVNTATNEIVDDSNAIFCLPTVLDLTKSMIFLMEKKNRENLSCNVSRHIERYSWREMSEDLIKIVNE